MLSESVESDLFDELGIFISMSWSRTQSHKIFKSWSRSENRPFWNSSCTWKLVHSSITQKWLSIFTRRMLSHELDLFPARTNRWTPTIHLANVFVHRPTVAIRRMTSKNVALQTATRILQPDSLTVSSQDSAFVLEQRPGRIRYSRPRPVRMSTEHVFIPRRFALRVGNPLTYTHS